MIFCVISWEGGGEDYQYVVDQKVMKLELFIIYTAKREVSEGEFTDTAMTVDFAPIYSSQDSSSSSAEYSSNNINTSEDEGGSGDESECMFESFIYIVINLRCPGRGVVTLLRL